MILLHLNLITACGRYYQPPLHYVTGILLLLAWLNRRSFVVQFCRAVIAVMPESAFIIKISADAVALHMPDSYAIHYAQAAGFVNVNQYAVILTVITGFSASLLRDTNCSRRCIFDVLASRIASTVKAVTAGL